MSDTGDKKAQVATIFLGMAEVLSASPPETWDRASLCEGWQVRHLVAHVTMPVALTPEQFGAEMAAAKGDFTTMSDAVAERESSLPAEDHLDRLRSPQLHEWEPPGGGESGALSHAVIHSLDVTIPLDLPPVAPPEAMVAVLDELAAANGSYFGLDLTGKQLVATDSDWRWGEGENVRAELGQLVALVSGRTLPDGRTLRA